MCLPQPSPETSHYDCAGGSELHVEESVAPIGWGARELSFMRSPGNLFGFVCAENKPLTLTHVVLAFCVKWGGVTSRLD